MIENAITSTPDLARVRKSIGGTNIIRRRSLIPQTKQCKTRNEERNDDDAERSLLVASERAVATSTPHASPRRNREGRDTMSSSPQKEHFQGCLKLFAENKINKDNAWNLQLIDFMTSMMRRHDARIENLQTASTLMDASTKIYSLRVDGVHYEVLKMAGGLSKAAQSKRGKKDDDVGTQDEPAAEGDNVAPVKKKKKRSKGAIAANPDVLNGDFDTNQCIDPFFERLATLGGDITASNRAFNATLPICDKTMALILRTDHKFLESIKENVLEEINLKERISIPANLLPPFTDDDIICEPFHKFSINNWDPDNETCNPVSNWVEENRLNLSQQAVAFDVNAEVEPIPQDEYHNDLYDEEPLGGVESEEEADVAVAACVAPADSRREYSYCGAIVAAWAGPAHWRLKNNRTSKISERTHSTGAKAVEGRRRNRRQLDFLSDGLAFDSAAPSPEHELAPSHKITISRKTLATGHTWNETNFKTPVDRGLDESHFRTLFLRRNVVMMRKRDLELSKQPVPEAEAVAEAEPLTIEHQEYDYNNENDASYCPNNVPEGEEWGPDEAGAGSLRAQLHDGDDIGDMLEPPTKVAKIFIPYAMRAKKVDMKQLKHYTWKMLTENNRNEEDITPTSFSSIYSRLPSKLSSSMQESLSVPLALLSILHLANEKGLVLEKKDNLRDIGIVGLIK